MNGTNAGELTMGVMRRSYKENERRLPIHPSHFELLDQQVRSRIFIEEDYGLTFGLEDSDLLPFVGGILPHDELIAQCDIILQPKPVVDEVRQFRPHQVLWGWPHSVQDVELTQIAIDKKLTFIAFEAMNHESNGEDVAPHVFRRNNEIAGYASVLHAMQLVEDTAHFGPAKKAVVIGSGATAHGAVRALTGLGFTSIDVLTRRDATGVVVEDESANVLRYLPQNDGRSAVVEQPGGAKKIPEFLADHDVIVNCILQDPLSPITFLDDDDVALLKEDTLIIDVSCDAGMGFSWARPTSFSAPMFRVGNRINHYSVSHSPSHFWRAATWENSEALLPFIPIVMSGPGAWATNTTLEKAIDIEDGKVRNQKILRFQNREAEYPYRLVEPSSGN